MFDQQEEKKLDWMYKGATSTVNREDYLLGRTVDKSLEQLNDEEKQQNHSQPKNRVEHECIPPSIRDFNKVVQAEQVDLSAKMQEDPLVAIRKREEESRREFLSNPVQLKKLQKALKAQAKKNKKKSKKSKKDDSEDDLDKRLTEKLLHKKKKKSKEEKDLDTILIHKYQDKLSVNDLKNILEGSLTESEDDTVESSSDSDNRRKPPRKTKKKNKEVVSKKKKLHRKDDTESSSSDSDERQSRKRKSRSDSRDKRPRKNSSRSPSNKRKDRKHESMENNKKNDNHRPKTVKNKNNYDSESDVESKPSKNYGLVDSKGKKIAFKAPRDERSERTAKKTTSIDDKKPTPTSSANRSSRKLTEEEKERLRKEMMDNAVWRDKEREKNVRRYKERDEKESQANGSKYDKDFAYKQIMKTTQDATVESRIKSNVSNIQRSKQDMNRHFSRRH